MGSLGGHSQTHDEDLLINLQQQQNCLSRMSPKPPLIFDYCSTSQCKWANIFKTTWATCLNVNKDQIHHHLKLTETSISAKLSHAINQTWLDFITLFAFSTLDLV